MHPYENIDIKQTRRNAKQFLKDYHDWKLESYRFQSWIQSPNLSSSHASGSVTNSTEERVVASANAEFECSLRLKTLEQLTQSGPKGAYYADLLRFRWLNKWSVKKVCEALADKYNVDFIAERTYATHQNIALWEFAIICPRNLMVKK